MDLNKVLFIGNVGKDPEIRVLPSGTAVANFSLATTERTKDQMGEYHDRTEWHYLVALNRTAEIVRDYVRKGSKVFIEGKEQTRSWDDKTSGERRYRTEVLIRQLILLSPARDDVNGHSNGNTNNGNQRYAAPSDHDNSDDFAGIGVADEGLDIPF